jgi:hypothetical protein
MERIARLESADTLRVRERIGPREVDVGNQVERIRLWKELGESRQHLRPVDRVKVRLVERVHALLGIVQPAGHLEDGRRIEGVDERVDDADGVDVVRIPHLRKVLIEEELGRVRGEPAPVNLLAELQPAVERGVGTNVPVDAEDLIGPELLDDALILIVVLAIARRIRGVRHREHPEHRLAD